MKALLFFCTILIITHVNGQEFVFKNIGTSLGLPSSETYHSLQDSKGYIWITTDGGICRYDGKTMTTFTSKDGLPENVVFNVYEDRKGRIWFNTMSGGVFYYSNGKFRSIAANVELLKSPYPGITSFFIGKGDTLYLTKPMYEGYLKVSPDNNYKKVKYKKISSGNEFLLTNPLHPQEIIMGTIQKIKSNVSTIYDCRKKKAYSILVKDLGSNMLRGALDDRKNLYIPNKNRLAVINRTNGKINYFEFPSDILFIKQDHQGDLWIGTNNGGYFYKNSNLNGKPVSFLNAFSISDILVDREGNIWVCTLQKGMFMSNSKLVLDTHFANDNVCTFEKNGTILTVGFNSGKILRIDKNNHFRFQNWPMIDGGKRELLTYMSEGTSFSLYGYTSNMFYSEGIRRHLIEDKRIHHTRNIPVRKIIELAKDSFVVASYLDLYFVNAKRKLYSITPPFVVQSMLQLKNGPLLIGSRDKSGLCEYKNGKIIPYLNQFPQLKTRINAIAEDKNGNLWIATNEQGLFCYSHHKLYAFNEKKGINSAKINEMDFDQKGNLWIATNAGINKIILTKGIDKATVQSFNESHGLPNLEIEHLQIFNNIVWCSTQEHLFSYEYKKMIPNTIKPLIQLKSVKMDDVLLNSSSSPILEYNQNNLSFEFTALSYKSSQERYVYQLAGYKTNWKTSTAGQCQFTNLPYGKYKFAVYALNNDSVKSKIPSIFRFEILKPFWLTWWWITLEILSFIGVMYLFLQWRISIVRKREEEKTKINQKLATFQMTAVRAQMNPHFVFNAISSIQHYILSNDTYNSYDYLAKFSHLIRNVLDNSQEEYISIEKEIITLSLYIELEKIRFKTPFEFILNVDDEIDEGETYIPTMVIQPFIENAIWHGLMPKQTDCKLELSIQQENETILITIKDNGVGRGTVPKPKEKQHVSKAMSLMQQRMKALGVKNNALYTVEIIDLKDENNMPNGTEVRITIPLEIE